LSAVISSVAWKTVDIHRSAKLSDARRQLHHAAQLATAFGISYLTKKPDDSHTNLEWIESSGGLASNQCRGSRVMLRVTDLCLLIDGASMSLIGHTVDDARNWMKGELGSRGFEPSAFTLDRHYEIPSHPVGSGARFDANGDDLDQLSRWFSNAAALFANVRRQHGNASEVRCWPHHFDIATLLSFDGGRSVGAGLEPGDAHYDEPYFYVNMYPSPQQRALPGSLRGGGQWHTREWVGAVLPASSISTDKAAQSGQVRAFLDSAIETNTRLIGAN
jgi:hypothetical protein